VRAGAAVVLLAACAARAANGDPLPGMPPLIDAHNVYSETAAGKLAPTVAQDLARVYVPNLRSHDVHVIDPATMKVVDRFKVGRSPQHVVPSWDLRTLWVTNNAERRNEGSLTPIDPRSGKPGDAVAVDDPYNMYFTPDGKSAIVVTEALKRLDFRDPKSMALQYSIDTPGCPGINHADFSLDGRSATFTCEFAGTLAKIDLVERKVVGYLKLQMPVARYKERPAAPRAKAGATWEPGPTEVCTAKKGMPQDIRISPDGKRYYVANRGSHRIHGHRRGDGGVTVIDFATEKIVARWPVPGGGSPDMGNVSADGRYLWLAGRYDDRVYRFDTTDGSVASVKVGAEPHGLTVWPQPGRYSVGHTGNMR
jgi:YVTN family beta-propeller protein